MQRNLAIPSLSSTIKYLSQRLLSKPWTGFSVYDTERTETDDLLERMSLCELGDLPLGPEPRFVDSGDPRFVTRTGPGKRVRLISQALMSEKYLPNA